MPWRGPRYRGELPTLGEPILEWMEANLAAPDRADYEPFRPTMEQAQFVLNYYAIDPRTGRRRYRRAVYSRPKGSGKSPLLAAMSLAEALANVVPDGWDVNGEPVGRPWSSVRTPLLQVAAVSEQQTKNCWSPLLEMARSGPLLGNYPEVDPMDTYVSLGRGRIEYVTSAPTSREGNRPVFCVLDQTEEWKVANGGVRLAATMRRNLGKTGGHSIESPNAYQPGAGSVSEASAAYYRAILEGRVKETGLLYDHREAPPETDLADPESLMAGLRYAYGDSALEAGGWVDLERIASEIWDPDTAPADARQFYLNQVIQAADSWLTPPEVQGRLVATEVPDGEVITVGFDGSRSRARGVADATALVGCVVSTGHLFELRVWEQPPGPAGSEPWRVPVVEVLAEVAQVFRRYSVVGFYADPARWESYVAAWEAEYGKRLKARASRDHPVEWWMTGGRAVHTVRALEQFHSAIVNGELTIDATSSSLVRHLLNARRRPSRSGLQIGKEHPDSPRKIDAAIAAVLAWEARMTALALGLSKPKAIPRRIR